MVESDGVRSLREAVHMAKILGYTQREAQFNTASRYYWGRQYDDLEPWTTSNCPLRDKAPSVQVGLTKKAVNKVNAHLFGEGHQPHWKIEDSRNAGKTSEALDEALQDVFERSGLKRRYLELGRLGTLHGTAAIGFHLFDGGRFDTEVLQAGTSKPTFGSDDRVRAIDLGLDFDDLLELDEFWRTFEEDEVSGNRDREIWHRRTWTTQQTIEYQPLDVRDAQATGASRLEDLPWVEDAEQTQSHDLGFVPAEWITPIPVAHDIDGAPIVDASEFKLEDEINYTLSQTGRGIRYNQEPTKVFTNVDANASDPVRVGADNTLMVSADPEAGGNAGASLLEMTGNGAVVAMDYSRMVRNLFNEIVQVVDHDPQQFAGALSGVALERLLYPMVLRVENLRPEYEHKLGRLLRKMLEADKVTGADNMVVSALWPPVVSPTAQDLQMYTTAVVELESVGIIDQKKAVEVLSPFLDIEDVDAYLADLVKREVAQGTTTGKAPANQP